MVFIRMISSLIESFLRMGPLPMFFLISYTIRAFYRFFKTKKHFHLKRYLLKIKNSWSSCKSVSVQVAYVQYEEENQSVRIALENTQILDSILSRLSTTDLLQCSLVNHLWRKQSRKDLRNKKHCKIILKRNVCCQLQRLNRMLENSNDLPFIGVHFKPIGHYYEDSVIHNIFVLWGIEKYIRVGWKILGWLFRKPGWAGCSKIKDEIVTRFPSLFQKLPVQYIFIDYPSKLDCLGDEFLRTLLLSTSVTARTEYLAIINWPKDIDSFSKYLLNSSQTSSELQEGNRHQFQNLKICNFKCRSLIALPLRSHLIREVVEAAPSLTKLHGSVLGAMLMEGSSIIGPHYLSQLPKCKHHLIKAVTVKSDSELYILELIEPKLELLILHPTILRPDISACYNNQYKIKRSLQRIVNNCKDTLICAYLVDCPQLLPSITNVVRLCYLRCLIVQINPCYPTLQRVCGLLQTIDFQKFLPSLTQIDVVFRDSQLLLGQLGEDSSMAMSTKFQCLSVRNMCINCVNKTFYDFNAPLIWNALAEVFPKIKTLQIPEFPEDTAEKFWDLTDVFHTWRSSLETLSCSYVEPSFGKPFWVMLIELMEALCFDISSEEMKSIDRSKFKDYAYAAKRPSFGSLRKVQIKLDHQFLCLLNYRYCEENWNERFQILSSWMEVKFPNVQIQVEYATCLGKLCNPFWLPVAVPAPNNSGGLDLGSKNRTVCLKAWSDIVTSKRAFVNIVGDNFRLMNSRLICRGCEWKENNMSTWVQRSKVFGCLFFLMCICCYTSYWNWEIMGLIFGYCYHAFSCFHLYITAVQAEERFGCDIQGPMILTWLILPSLIEIFILPLISFIHGCCCPWITLPRKYLVYLVFGEAILHVQKDLQNTCENQSFIDLISGLNYCANV